MSGTVVAGGLLAVLAGVNLLHLVAWLLGR